MEEKNVLKTFLTHQKQNIPENSSVIFRDIEIIFCEVLEISNIQLITETQKILTESEISEISEKISDRVSGKSISEIFQKKMFFGKEFFVTNDVLTPRPETEFLVEKALKFLAEDSKRKNSEISGILDVGTGSGCIITSIANNFFLEKNLEFIASDISEKALEVARKNAEKILQKKQKGDHKGTPLEKTENTISFRKSDLLSEFSVSEISEKIIVTNLPYIPKKDESFMDKEVLVGDPYLALFSGDTGLDLYKEFFSQLKQKSENAETSPFYAVIFEYDPPQTEFFQTFLGKLFPERCIEFFKDLSGEVRFGVLK